MKCQFHLGGSLSQNVTTVEILRSVSPAVLTLLLVHYPRNKTVDELCCLYRRQIISYKHIEIYMLTVQKIRN